MPDAANGFLDVEEMARGLVSSLSRLHDESSRYAGAATHLAEAAGATRELSAAVREVGEGAVRAIEVLASIGGPAIARQLAAVEQKSDGIATQLAAIEQKHDETTKALLREVRIAAVLAGISGVVALAAVIVGLVR